MSRRIPQRQYSRAAPSRLDLRDLLRELEKRRAPETVKSLFVRLSSLSPDTRLGVNLRVVVSLMSRLGGEIDNVLSEGLSSVERAALCYLDMRGFSIPARETAHGLLNIHERWILIRALSKSFKRARLRGNERVGCKPLDDLLGD